VADATRTKARREAAKALAGIDVRSMAPATKDLLQILSTRRKALAVVAEVPTDRPEEAARVAAVDLSAIGFDGDERGLAIAARQKPPALFLAPCFTREQVWAARLAGASAVVVSASASPEERSAVEDAARRTHMLPVFEAEDDADAGAVRVVLVRDPALLPRFPTPSVAIAAASTADEARSLRGRADAVLLAPEVSLETDFESLVAELEA
jgi:hypothetical protein